MGNIEIFSGPPSCLCSKPEECEITGDNELDVVPSVAEVTMKIFQIFLLNIFIFTMPGVSVSGDVRYECRVWILQLVKYQLTSWSFCNDMVVYLCFVSLPKTNLTCLDWMTGS